MEEFTWKSIMKHRNVIYGIAAIWIVMFHINEYHPVKNHILYSFFRTGNMGVDVFLFLSAIGLSFSIEKNSVKAFYINRLKRTYIPFLLIVTPFFIWTMFVLGKSGISGIPMFLANLSTATYWFKYDFPVWYVPCVLSLYAFFPLLYKLHKKNRCITILIIVLFVAFEMLLRRFEAPIFKYAEGSLSRVPVFLMGIFASDYVKTNKKVSLYSVIIAFAVVILFIFVFPVRELLANQIKVFERYAYCFISISFVIVLGVILNFSDRFFLTKKIQNIFAFLGGISLEIYLTHECMMRLMMKYNIMHGYWDWLYYVVISTSGIFWGYVFNKLLNKILIK